jgi:hypothetical protein
MNTPENKPLRDQLEPSVMVDATAEVPRDRPVTKADDKAYVNPNLPEVATAKEGIRHLGAAALRDLARTEHKAILLRRATRGKAVRIQYIDFWGRIRSVSANVEVLERSIRYKAAALEQETDAEQRRRLQIKILDLQAQKALIES